MLVQARPKRRWLLAVRMVGRIRVPVGAEVDTRVLLGTPTPAGRAEHVGARPAGRPPSPAGAAAGLGAEDYR
ncbi:hypothetical protein [Dactylosporangium sp. NPDC051484]|uniref:hypothetical protein n=1 Tax=Dactylosporangium sp. NPDC051484 TaxID=3154942 RepID=UPI00344B931B